jgi:hypothetical protein
MIFFTIFFKTRHERMILWRTDECSFMLQAIYAVLQMLMKGRRENVHSRSVWDSSQGLLVWKPILLTFCDVIVNKTCFQQVSRIVEQVYLKNRKFYIKEAW